ncbi:MAG: pilus assembly PilX N-terminal domain-containing protein [bacterium]
MNEKGSIIFGIIILTAVLVTGIAAGILVVQEVQLTANFENSVTAYYTAESGIEDTLYQIKVDPESIPETVPGTVLGGDGSYLVTITNPQTDCLIKDKTQQIYIDRTLDPEISCVKITWVPPPAPYLTCGYTSDTPNPWIEYKTYSVNNSLSTSGVLVEKDSGTGLTDFGTVEIKNLEANKNYYIRFKPLYNDAQDVVVEGFAATDCSGTSQLIHTEIQLNAEGIYNFNIDNNRQAIRNIQVNKGSSSLHGVFDYAIFSDLDLEKAP